MAIRHIVALGIGLGLLLALFFGSDLAQRNIRPIADRPLKAWDDGSTPRKIVAFGTSLTAGNAWPDRLASSLSACFGHRVDVTRVAAPGAGSAWAIKAVQNVVVLEPDVVLVEFAINDADLRDGVDLATSRLQHAALFDTLARELPKAQVVAMTMSPAYGVRRLLRPRLGNAYAQVVELATERGLALVDLYPRWLEMNDKALLPDGVHPTDAATLRVIDPTLLNAFAKATGRSC